MSDLTCPRLRVRQRQLHRAAAAAGSEDLPTLADELLRAATAAVEVADDLRTTRGRLERALQRLRRYLAESALPPRE